MSQMTAMTSCKYIKFTKYLLTKIILFTTLLINCSCCLIDSSGDADEQMLEK